MTDIFTAPSEQDIQERLEKRLVSCKKHKWRPWVNAHAEVIYWECQNCGLCRHILTQPGS